MSLVRFQLVPLNNLFMNPFSLFNKLIDFIFACFLRGLLVIAPFLLTTYIVKTCFDLSKQVLGLGLPNYWILIFIFLIFFCGYFTKNIIVRFFYGVMELIVLEHTKVQVILQRFYLIEVVVNILFLLQIPR